MKSGTLLFSFKLSIGKMAFAGCRMHHNEAIAALPIRDTSVLDRKFLYYSLQSTVHDLDANRAVFGKVLNKSKVEAIEISVPPLSKQTRIAKIIGDWDKAIWNLASVRKAKQRRNVGIRRLLFDATRTRDWKKVPLASLATISKGVQLNRTDMKGGPYPVWNGGVVPSGYTDTWTTEANTITISEGGSCGFVNLCRQRFWAGGHCYVLQDPSVTVDLEFLYHFLKCMESEIARRRVGTALPNIRIGEISRLALRLPDLLSQRRIGSFLSLAWSETDSLVKLIGEARRQKRGLVQKLLN